MLQEGQDLSATNVIVLHTIYSFSDKFFLLYYVIWIVCDTQVIYRYNVYLYIYIYISTWSHKKSYLCALFSETIFTYLTARFTAVTKRNAHWEALKHRFSTWTLAHFYYIHIDTYCCVFITLLQERIAAVQNSNIQGLLLKMYVLSGWKYALHKNQP